MIFMVLGIVFCFLMTFGVGANDLANVMSTTIGSKAVSVKQAIILAIIFEFSGALLGGSDITNTMRDGIINIGALSNDPKIIIEGMLSILIAGTIWMNLASYIGVPVSITNALVGSMVGFGSVVLGVNAIEWHEVKNIAIGWVTSPLISGITAYMLFISIQNLIFVSPNPLARAKTYIPIYLFLVGCILSFIIVFKGLLHFHINLSIQSSIMLTIGFSIVITIIGMFFIRMIPEHHPMKRRESFLQVERYFGVLMAMTACAMIFAHGANDVSLTVGPLTIIHSLIFHPKESLSSINYPPWIIIFAASAVVIGFLSYGRRVIETVGSSITALTPSRAFAATLAAATSVVSATSLGIPVSATQTLVGAVLGVGLARGIGALNLIVIRNIFTSWILTLPAASILSILSYKVLHLISQSFT
jgi:inorganic phosphate transporter, PiT family